MPGFFFFRPLLTQTAHNGNQARAWGQNGAQRKPPSASPPNKPPQTQTMHHDVGAPRPQPGDGGFALGVWEGRKEARRGCQGNDPIFSLSLRTTNRKNGVLWPNQFSRHHLPRTLHPAQSPAATTGRRKIQLPYKAGGRRQGQAAQGAWVAGVARAREVQLLFFPPPNNPPSGVKTDV